MYQIVIIKLTYNTELLSSKFNNSANVNARLKLKTKCMHSKFWCTVLFNDSTFADPCKVTPSFLPQ
nr:hypothetical protein DDGNMFGP_00071 [Gallid alphaherpesvirus 2]